MFMANNSIVISALKQFQNCGSRIIQSKYQISMYIKKHPTSSQKKYTPITTFSSFFYPPKKSLHTKEKKNQKESRKKTQRKDEIN